MSAPEILVGDVGGTNARLARATRGPDDAVALSDVARKPVAQFQSLEAALADWLRETGEAPPAHAVFALAGPTGADEVRFINSPWVVSATAMRDRFGFQTVTLVNDFAAQARAVPAMGADMFETLIPGARMPGAPIVVLGPGTGLGLATCVPIGADWHVLASEGGHHAFAPLDARERAMLEPLMADLDRDYVGFEDVVSGHGLDRIHRVLARMRGRSALLKGAPEIGAAAIAGDDPLAVEAAEVLALALATFAGNAVLVTGARGGCVIAGGVAEALAPFLRTPAFARRFASRGRMSHYFENVPLQRARDPFAALKGAAFFAPQGDLAQAGRR